MPPWPPSWRSDLARVLLKPRLAVMSALLLTYIWRFHSLHPALLSLRIAAIATVASWVFLAFRPNLGQLKQVFRLPYVWCAFAFSAWAGITGPMALRPDIVHQAWVADFLKTTVMLLFVLSCLTKLAVVRLAVATHVFGGTVLALFYIKSGFSQAVTPVPGYDRNDFALALNTVIPMALYLGLASRQGKERMALFGCAAAMGLCVMMSQSRGGFLTLGCIALFAMVRVEGIKLRYRLLPPILMVLTVVFAPQHIKDRLATLLSPTEDYNYNTEMGRIAIWTRGLGYLQDHLVFGVGMSNFPVAEAVYSGIVRRSTGQGAATHNSFLQVAVETGIPGILLYLGMVLSAMYRLLSLRTRFRRFRGDLQASHLALAADFILVAILGYCIGAFFLSRAYSPLPFSLIALAAGLEVSAARWAKHRRAAHAYLVSWRARSTAHAMSQRDLAPTRR